MRTKGHRKPLQAESGNSCRTAAGNSYRRRGRGAAQTTGLFLKEIQSYSLKTSLRYKRARTDHGSYPRKWKRWVYRHRITLSILKGVITTTLAEHAYTTHAPLMSPPAPSPRSVLHSPNSIHTHKAAHTNLSQNAHSPPQTASVIPTQHLWNPPRAKHTSDFAYPSLSDFCMLISG